MAKDFEKKYSFSPLAYYLYLPNLYPGIGTKDGTAKTDKDFKAKVHKQSPFPSWTNYSFMEGENGSSYRDLSWLPWNSWKWQWLKL